MHVRKVKICVQGDCSQAVPPPEPATGPALRRRNTSQCSILSDADVFSVEGAEHELGMSNMAMRIAREQPGSSSAAADELPTLVSVYADNAKVILQDMAFQGDAGAGRALSMDNPSSSTVLGSSQVTDFDVSEQPAVTTAGTLRVAAADFLDNTATPTDPNQAAPVIFGRSSATVRLQAAAFDDNGAAPLGQSAGSEVVRRCMCHACVARMSWRCRSLLQWCRLCRACSMRR